MLRCPSLGRGSEPGLRDPPMTPCPQRSRAPSGIIRASSLPPTRSPRPRCRNANGLLHRHLSETTLQLFLAEAPRLSVVLVRDDRLRTDVNTPRSAHVRGTVGLLETHRPQNPLVGPKRLHLTLPKRVSELRPTDGCTTRWWTAKPKPDCRRSEESQPTMSVLPFVAKDR